MRSFDRVQTRLAGRTADRVPNFNIMMTFAAKHVGRPLREYYTDHRALVQANLAMVEDFGLDLVQAISDPYREAADWGLAVEFPENNLPLAVRPLIVEPGDLAKLKPPVPERGRRMSDRLAAVRSFREQVGGVVPIMGWVEGGLAEAADLRGMSHLLMDLIQRPDWAGELVGLCAETAAAFAIAQMKAGADVIGLGDAVASQISAAMYRRFALPHEQRIFEAAHRLGGLARLHICGDVTHLLPDMLESGADIIDLDWMVDWAAANELVGDRAALCGNFDPVGVMLHGSPDLVYRAATTCLDQGGPRSLSMAGCEIPIDTPPENLAAHNRALRDYRAR